MSVSNPGALPAAPLAATARPRRAIARAFGIAAVTLFSAFTLVSRLGLVAALHPLDLAALRFSIGGTILLPVLWRHRRSPVRPRDAALLAALGGVGFATCAYTGFSLAPAAHGAVLLHGTLPLSTFALAYLFGDRLHDKSLVGVAVILLGIVAMAADTVVKSTPRQLLGDGALLLASVSWSGYGLRARRLGLHPAHAASIVAVLSAVAFLPIYVLARGSALRFVPWRALLLQGFFQGVLIGAVSIFVYTRAVALLGAVETALYTAAVPCITTATAIAVLGERPGVIALAGVVVVTAGMAMTLRRSRSLKACAVAMTSSLSPPPAPPPQSRARPPEG
jgi:drug/metabolite transporter (DMT)-like permease